MDYRIKRGDQEFGPYVLSDLLRYLQSGHVLASDMAMSEGMSAWVPVAQVVGNIPIPVTGWQGAATDSSVAESQQIVGLPPNLHWGWVLVIDLLTRSFFNFIWAFVQANWARKLSGKNISMVLISMYPGGIICGALAIGVGTSTGNNSALGGLGAILMFGGIICLIAGVFSIRSAMENYYNSVENIGLSLSGAMTFFFSVIYIQYHINRLHRWKKTGTLS